MRYKRIIIAVAALSFVASVGAALFAMQGISLHYTCYQNTIQSAYEIPVQADGDVPYMALLGTSALLAALSAVCLGLYVGRREPSSRVRASAVVLLCACVGNLVVGLCLLAPDYSYMRSELEKAEALLPADYLDNDWLQEMSLDDLAQCFSSGDIDTADYPLYIGRAGCPECEQFEEKITPILSREGIEVCLPTYYTSEDRDGARRDEMYALLDKIKVESVPAMLVVYNGEILARWDDPTNSIGQIEAYLKTGELP